MMDEYERAAWELRDLIGRISAADFERVVDAETEDESCRSVQSIMAHVVAAGYGYANYLRPFFDLPTEATPPREVFSHAEAAQKIDRMLEYTVETLDGRWEMSDDEIDAVTFTTRWGNVFNMEQILEHAIVHILRHRRQIEKFAANGLIKVDSE